MASSKRTWFGTDGIRGTYGETPMTPDFVYACGKAAVRYFKNHSQSSSPLFIIGRDTRASGPSLENALTLGLQSEGAQIQSAGVLPTAGVALLTINYQATAGIMISASHNEFSDNGIKFFGPDGFKLDDSAEVAIESHLNETLQSSTPQWSSLPLDFKSDPHSINHYAERLKASVPAELDFSAFSLCLDPGNGAAYHSSPLILKSLGATIQLLHAQPDGQNINASCGSQHTEDLQNLVKQNPNSIGIAHDGDADRMIAVDEKGIPLDGDEVLAIIGLHLLKKGQLKKNTIVATVMSNLGLDDAFKKAGGTVHRTAVGDRYVLEAMQKNGFNLGGEQSGHMIFLDHMPTGDGLLSAIQLLCVVRESETPLYELRQALKKYPQKLTNLMVREKKPLEEMLTVTQALQKAESQLGDKGRAFLRYSGTEKKIRLLVEAADPDQLDPITNLILQPLQDEIGVS